MWEVRRGERMVNMTEQTEVLMRAKTAGFSGVVITCRDHSSCSMRVLFLSAQGVG